MTTPPRTPNLWQTPAPFTPRFADNTPVYTQFTPVSPTLTPKAMDFSGSPRRKRSVVKNPESPSIGKTSQFAQQSGQFPKSAGKENSPLKADLAFLLCPDEEAFSETTGSSTFAQYKMPSTPEKEKTQSHTSAPFTKAQQEMKDRFTISEEMWDSLAYPEIGEGNFHKALLDAINGIVYKIPNDKYRKKSKHTVDSVPICFVHVLNAYENYLALQRAKLPGLLKLAKTAFNIENAIITQEKWDEPFVPERDLKNPMVRETIKSVLQLLANGDLPDIDFRPANLGWKNGELKLFDFLEERDNKSIHTLKQFANEFASEFEERGNEIIKTINKPLYEYLVPKQKVLFHYR